MKFSYFIDRAKEASTWRGLLMIGTAFGVNVAPELADAVIATGIGLAGVVGVLTKDKQ